MSDNKKIVIKINYPNRFGELAGAKKDNIAAVSEWNIKRIIVALTVLCLLLGIGVYFWINSRDIAGDASISLSESPVKTGSPVGRSSGLSAVTGGVRKELNTTTRVPADKPPAEQPVAAISQPLPDAARSGAAAPLIQHDDEPESGSATAAGEVVRALLAKSIRRKEPYGDVALPLLLGKNEKRRIYYFTELKNMAGQRIYHEWLYKGKSVFKRPIKITEQRWRTSSHKVIRSTALGGWTVRLIDASGKIMHQIDFQVAAANDE
ncbi:MAG: DUF2914 domain-containing protein [Gammaproteobacteria bacterium]